MAETGDIHGERRIMVAVDESEESMYALSWALDFLCIQPNDTIILLHAQPLPKVYSAIDGYIFTYDLMQSLQKCQERITQDVFQRAKQISTEKNVQMCLQSRVAVGHARDVICEEAEKVGADLVVIGSHGYGAIKRAFLGSVSDYCAHNVKCPVMIVKHPKKK
ncbi:universal stress protein [Soehngenia saccharolytica]|nr:universal stress protein [Soehngenia saccharolytica]